MFQFKTCQTIPFALIFLAIRTHSSNNREPTPFLRNDFSTIKSSRYNISRWFLEIKHPPRRRQGGWEFCGLTLKLVYEPTGIPTFTHSQVSESNP